MFGKKKNKKKFLVYSHSMYKKHREQKGTVVLSCDHCSSTSHGPAITVLTQEVCNQVHFRCLLEISNYAFSENISTADYRVFWDRALFISAGEAVFSLQLLKFLLILKEDITGL